MSSGNVDANGGYRSVFVAPVSKVKAKASILVCNLHQGMVSVKAETCVRHCLVRRFWSNLKSLIRSPDKPLES